MNGVSEIRPIQSVEAEQVTIGTMLLNPGACHLVSSDIFYDPIHADIHRICKEREKTGEPVSPVALAQWANEHEGLKDLGGAAYLVRMAGVSVSRDLVRSYIDIMRDAKARRDMLSLFSEAQAQTIKGEESPDVIMARVEARIQALEPVSRSRPVSMLSAVTNALEASYMASQGEESSVGSGIGRLDDLTGGFFAGEMTLLGGRPSMGKTAVALSIALNAARAGHSVAIASLEMTPESLATRAISEATTYGNQWGAVSYSDIRRGNLSDRSGEAVKDAARAIAELPITFLPSDYSDVGALTAGVRQIAKHGLDFLVIDYAQLMRAKGSSRYEEITEISRSLKRLAVQEELPILALSQLSRALEQRNDKRPMLSDLRESGQLEQDADAVIFCYRDEYYLEREEPDMRDLDKHEAWSQVMSAAKNKLELIVAKNRQGAIGTAHVMCNPALNKVWE